MNRFFTSLRTWSFWDREALISLCNAVDRTFLLGRLPNPYTETDADRWLTPQVSDRSARRVGKSLAVELPQVEFVGAHRAPEDGTKASERSFSVANWL